MPRVQFTTNLKRFFPSLCDTNIEASTVADLIRKLNGEFPGIKDYILDDQNILRQHVNIFINNNVIIDRMKLQDKVLPKDDIFIMQALSGG